MGDVHGASNVGHVIEVAIWVGIREADGGRKEALLNSFDAGDGLDATAGTEQMPVHGLRRGDCKLVGCITEYLFDGPRFVDVVERCRRSVGVEIVDLRGGE